MISAVFTAVSAQAQTAQVAEEAIKPQSESECLSDGTDLAKMSGNWSGFWKDVGIPKKHMITVKFCITNNLIVGDVGLDDGRDFNVTIGFTQD